jgi:hypothetical protein
LTPNRLHERLVALFLLGVLLFAPPLLALFNNPYRVLGLPMLYLYLFGAWGVIIVLAAVTIHRTSPDVDLSTARPEPTSSTKDTNAKAS